MESSTQNVLQTAQGSAAIVGIRALKDNTRRSIKRMVSVSQPDTSATTKGATRGANLDVMVNSSAGHDIGVRQTSVTFRDTEYFDVYSNIRYSMV